MAHQNLRFKVNTTNNTDWQPIYGAQHHGTFYMIYIKFIKHEHKENIGGKMMHFYECSFKLQNYRGAITMGLVSVEESTKFTSVEGVEGEVLNINIKVRPFTKNDELTEKQISVNKEISNGLTGVINVLLQNPPLEFFNPENHNTLDKSIYINPYSHTRDGDHYNEISSRPVGSKEPFPDPNDISMRWPDMGFCLPDIITFV